MARYLVTGATGFLGSHLVSLLAQGGHEVLALCRGDKGRSDLAALREAGATIRHGDVLDEASLVDAMSGADGVFHLAGKVSRKAEDAEELYRVHVEGTKKVLSACKAARVKRVVHASTSGVIGVSESADAIATEDDKAPLAIIARWPYYRAKLFAEQAALETKDVEVVVVNPSLLLGPGDRYGSSTEDVRLFLERKVPAVPPGGIAFVDVRDAAQGLLLAMDKGQPSRRYILSACNMTIREFFSRLERASGVKAPWMPMPHAPGLARVGYQMIEDLAGRYGFALPVDASTMDFAQHHWYVDASRAEMELGWSSRDPMNTLADTIADLRARGVVWPSLDA